MCKTFDYVCRHCTRPVQPENLPIASSEPRLCGSHLSVCLVGLQRDIGSRTTPSVDDLYTHRSRAELEAWMCDLVELSLEEVCCPSCKPTDPAVYVPITTDPVAVNRRVLSEMRNQAIRKGVDVVTLVVDADVGAKWTAGAEAMYRRAVEYREYRAVRWPSNRVATQADIEFIKMAEKREKKEQKVRRKLAEPEERSRQEALKKRRKEAYMREMELARFLRPMRV